MPMEVKEQLVSWGSLPGGGVAAAWRRRLPDGALGQGPPPITPRRLWPTPACYPWHTQRSTLGNRSEQLELQQHTHCCAVCCTNAGSFSHLALVPACLPAASPPRRRTCVLRAPPPPPKPTSCFWLAVSSHYVLLHTPFICTTYSLLYISTLTLLASNSEGKLESTSNFSAESSNC